MATTKKVRIHCNSMCHDCDWINDDMNESPREAVKHAQKYEHKVTVEEGITHSIFYN